jgi:hypothetical protein
MKIIIIGGVSEGKTVFARALQELCKRFGIIVTVNDSDFFGGNEVGGWSYASVSTRLHGLSEKGTRVEIITVQTTRDGRIPRDKEHVCEGLLQIIRDDIERDHVLPPGGWDKK